MNLLDIFKRKEKQVDQLDLNPVWDLSFPSNLQKDKNSLSDELSSGNYNLFLGLGDLMPNPDPVLKKLGIGKDVDAYLEILSDPQLYGAIENNRKPGVTSLLSTVVTPDGDKKETEFIEKYIDTLRNDGIYDTIFNQSLDTPQFGRTVFGTVWEDVEGYWVPTKISLMPYSLCKFDIKGNLLVSEDGVNFNIPQHPAKYIVLRHKPTIDNPYGEALLSKCYWNVRFKKDGYKLWATFMERFGMPWVKSSYNPAAIAKSFSTDMSNAANILMKKLSLMSKNGIIVFPDGVTVDLTNSMQTSASIDVFERMVRICDEQNTKLQLGHSGATESTSGDKLSNDTTATDVRSHVIVSDRKYPQNLINHLIYWIHYFNFSNSEIPKFELYKEEDVDQSLATRDATLVPVLTLSGLKLSQKYFEDNYEFKDGDLEQLDTTNQDTSKKQNNNLQNQNLNIGDKILNQILNKAKSKEDHPDQQLIDDIVDEVSSNDEQMQPLLDVVRKFIDKQSDYEEAISNIADLYPDMTGKELLDQFERILFAADIVGRLSVKDELGI